MYILDTNACIALLEERSAKLTEHFARATEAGGRFHISSIVLAELWYGIGKSQRPQKTEARLNFFLSWPLSPLPFDDQDAVIAGKIRAELENKGRMIGPFDTLIAAQALRHKYILITANVREFSRVNGLQWEDWMK